MSALLKTKTREIILIVTILLIGAVITLIAPAFLTKLNLVNMLYSNVVLGVMTMGMMMVIVTGNIDVSVGAQYAVCGMLVAMFVKETGGQYVVASLLVGMTAGTVLGLLNGLLVAKLKIPAIVVTLSTLNIMRGVLYLISRGNWIDGLKGPFARFASQRFLGLQTAVYIWMAVLLITYFLLYRTGVGRDVLAVGGNKTAARRLGINETKVYLLSFGYMGLLAGLAAGIASSKLKIAQPSNGLGYEMQLIAACVIGGTLFSGGVASILGTLLGVLLIGMIDNGLVLAKVPVYWQELTTGIIIILAVASGVLKGGGLKRTGKKSGGGAVNENG